MVQFESQFEERVIEIGAVIGPSGSGAGKGPGSHYWTASIGLIAWKDLSQNEVVSQELRLKWLADEEEWKNTNGMLQQNTLVRLLVRKGQQAMMLVKVLDTSYQDEDLERILQEALKPVFYQDPTLGEFELYKSLKMFQKQVTWAGDTGMLYFDLDEDPGRMEASLRTAYALFGDQEGWSARVRAFAADELVELANEWLADDEEAEVDEITHAMFMERMELSSISVDPDGGFEMYFHDGDMFWGHAIVLDGNIDGSFGSAEIAG